MTIDEAHKFWNDRVDTYNQKYERIGFHVDKYELYWNFAEALSKNELSYQQLMSYAENLKIDLEVDVIWENYQ